MILIPAIDIKNGKCVRLLQGRMEDVTVYSEDPTSQAVKWVSTGAKRLHIVDLDGAAQGKPVNAQIIERLVRSVPGIEIQIGGGIRDLETIQSYLATGAQYVVLGTRAVQDPSFLGEANELYPDRIIAGLDVRDGAAAVEAWTGKGRTDILELAAELERNGAAAIVYTDIERDGMLSGVNAEATAELAEQCKIPVIASGGISGLDDLRRLMNYATSGITGAISGKALYEGKLDFQAALELLA